MIQAEELRIGNWVEHKKEWSHRSAGIVAPFNFQWEDRDWYALGESTLGLDAVQPIPLTPEILEKAGFIFNDDADWFELKNWNPYVIKKGKTALLNDIFRLTTFKVDWNLAELKYLHQLQNLYYALTGEELKINLT